ncbi:MAG: PEP-CTERM sorting domain-containing protein [Acidobacteriaceae bacterium]|nr:PEP-CTERM sorting domain-containing protein [Acidobacteriaceae bacterium]
MKFNLTGRLALLTVLAVAAVNATTIDFEAQGTSAPSTFNTTLNSPLVIGIATFTGGKLLKNEAVAVPPPAETSAVYATTGFLTGYTDPLVITFTQPVSNVSLIVTNQTPDTYTLADNLGHSSSLAIGNNVNQMLSLTDTGATQVTIGTNATVGWDFAIDNVTFTVSSAPEPNTIALMALGLAGALLKLRWTRAMRNGSAV